MTQKREIITLDMRQPGQADPAALDVLGDLGASLPASFDEAFTGYNATYSGDWKHVCNDVDGAAAVLQGIDADAWNRSMRDAIWNRNKDQRDALLAQAYTQRLTELVRDVHKCPVHALDSYICNNWHRMRSARFKAMGVDYVSARAEAQVRERTRKRFEVPGAWRQENLEGKATLRAIIDEGSWPRFCQWCRGRSMDRFSRQLAQRLEDAVAQGRLSQLQADNFFNQPPTAQAEAA